MTSTCTNPAFERELMHPFEANPGEAAILLRHEADRMGSRARRIRERVHGLDGPLEPLQVAMRRRACELELTRTALVAIAEGLGDRATSSPLPPSRPGPDDPYPAPPAPAPPSPPLPRDPRPMRRRGL